MADLPPYRDAADDTGVGAGRGSAPGTPRWVKVSGIIALALVIMVVVMLLIGGEHGPGRHIGGHTPSGDVSAPTTHEGGHR